MTRTILVHYDGRVIVPDEPAGLPVQTPLRASFEWSDPACSREAIEDRRRRLEIAKGCISAPAPSAESLRRENLYGDDA